MTARTSRAVSPPAPSSSRNSEGAYPVPSSIAPFPESAFMNTVSLSLHKNKGRNAQCRGRHAQHELQRLSREAGLLRHHDDVVRVKHDSPGCATRQGTLEVHFENVSLADNSRPAQVGIRRRPAGDGEQLDQADPGVDRIERRRADFAE